MAQASPLYPGFEPHVPHRFRSSAHLLSAVFKHDSSLSKQAYKTRERLARCCPLGARRVKSLRNVWELTIRNTDKTTLPATSATREVPASRCTKALPALALAFFPRSFTLCDPLKPPKRLAREPDAPLCLQRLVCSADLISGQLAGGANRQLFPRFPPTSPDSLLLALMALFFDNFRKPKPLILPGWT